MKARVKETGEIVEARRICQSSQGPIWEAEGSEYYEYELDFDMKEPPKPPYSPDYWTRLEHQYAGMAMQGLLANHYITDRIDISVLITEAASTFAKSLVEKARYEENPKELEGLKKELEALKIEKTILENKIKLLKEERK